MSFNKTKAKKDAERFLSQGKIPAAIIEYKQIVENDPKDFSTLNILGDLYIKNSEKQEAVKCFTKVAEHYNSQGFAHKAIAVFNKISRIEPNSIAVSEKLAQLYHQKGSLSEARTHYNILAEQYQKKGQKAEVLDTWKKIAELDPNNTEIYLKIGESCEQENRKDEATSAFTEAGLRFSSRGEYEGALKAFTKALELKKNDLRALNGLVKAQINLGSADEASKTLENILVEHPYNRDILYLLVDCYLDMDSPAKAESAVIKLVEQEPANYPKFLDLVKTYLKNDDLESASRVLSISSEHLLVGGQAEEFLSWTNEILAKNPEQINALRLLVRYYGWQRDEDELKQALQRLADAARLCDAPEDERYALQQLVMILPNESEYAQRLHEINIEHGFEDEEIEVESVLPKIPVSENVAVFESGNGSNGHVAGQNGNFGEFVLDDKKDFSVERNGDAGQNGNSEKTFDDAKEFNFSYDDAEETESAEDQFEFAAPDEEESDGGMKLSDELKLQKELESIEFYIAQEYKDLAAKALDELEAEFGKRDEFEILRLQINNSPETVETGIDPEITPISGKTTKAVSAGKKFEALDEMFDELGLDESPADAPGDDYETHYHLATAYKEMGLMEEAIREFQDAINLVETDDEARRFFQCSNLLGHCFMEKQMPNLAVVWYKRGLAVTDLEDDEKQAIYYEMGNAYEADGDIEKAIEYFEKLYAENVDYRDVSSRLHDLRENPVNA